MGNTAKRDAQRLEKASRAKRGAELRIQGKSWQAIADELGYADRSGARKAVDAYRQELPRAAVEELRDELLERAEKNYADAVEAASKLKTPQAKLAAAAKIARILEQHARVGHVIQEGPPAVVTVTQTNNAWDLSKLSPERLAQLHAAEAEARGEASPLAAQPARDLLHPCANCQREQLGAVVDTTAGDKKWQCAICGRLEDLAKPSAKPWP